MGNKTSPFSIGYNSINENFRYYMENEKEIPKEIKGYLEDVIDYANTHQLTVQSIATEKHDPLRQGDQGRITVYDNITGKTLTIADSALRDFHENNYEIGTSLDSLVVRLREIPKTYEGYQLTENIHLYKSGTEYGYFYHGRPNEICISSENLYGWAVSNSNRTGLNGTIYHEMGHLLDYHKNGVCGNDGLFSKSRKYQPTGYGDEERSEVISTVLEQVGTQTLRPDAHMRDGRRVSRYARDNGFDSHDKQKLYQIWYNEWIDLTIPAEKLIYG